MSYQFKFRSYYSLQFLKSARLFCDYSFDIENNYANNFDEMGKEYKLKLIEDNFSFVTGTIISCLSFLEANINEIYCDANDTDHSFIQINLI